MSFQITYIYMYKEYLTLNNQQWLIWKFTKLFAQMWLKAIWKGHPMRLELTRVGLLVELANHYTTRGAFNNGWYAIKLNQTKSYV